MAPTVLPEDALAALRRRMTADAGVTRNARGLIDLVGWIDGQAAAYGESLALVAARLVASAALARPESGAARFAPDFPGPLARGVRSGSRLGGGARPRLRYRYE
jgi:L-aspartate oxidase